MQFLHVVECDPPVAGCRRKPIIKPEPGCRSRDRVGVGAGGGAARRRGGHRSGVQRFDPGQTRQPELRAEVERDPAALGFALTEACFFYGSVGGFIAFFL